MRLRHIEVFNAIMLTGSVSAAARMLNVSQPAVTRVLQHAELDLGFPLFRRDRGRLVATEEAITLQAEVKKLFQNLDSVRRLSNSLRKGGSGHIRILAIPSLAQSLLADALAEMQRASPTISFEIRTLHSREIIAALLLREADIGFVFEASAHPAIHGDVIHTCELVAVVPKVMDKHPRGASLTRAELGKLPAIRLSSDDPVGRLLAEGYENASGQAPIQVQTYFVALRLAENGLGVACVDPYTATFADRSKVGVRRIEPPIVLRTCALRARTSAVSIPIRQLVDAFVKSARLRGGRLFSESRRTSHSSSD